MTARPVFRFAPSPNGALHLGHAYSAIFSFEAARRAGGRFLLRIEDIDHARSNDTFVDNIFRDLAWLGLTWEQPVRRQSAHMDDYRAAVAKLDALGVLYRCFATRSEIAAALAHDPAPARDPDGGLIYPGLHKDLSAADRARLTGQGRRAALRLDTAKACRIARQMNNAPLTFLNHRDDVEGGQDVVAATPEIWGDVVIARKDISTSYHLSVVVDDAIQHITTVTRGQDLFAATHIHRLLQVLLELPEPEYCHHRLIHDESGRRLSKSARDKSLESLRAAGTTPARIRALTGLPPTADEMPGS